MKLLFQVVICVKERYLINDLQTQLDRHKPNMYASYGVINVWQGEYDCIQGNVEYKSMTR